MWARKSTNIDLRIAEATQGWIAHEELQWLAEQALTHKCIVEIGSYLGRSTRALGDNTPGVVYAIDNFLGPQDIALPPPITQHIFELFCYNTGSLINAHKVVPVVADHGAVDLEVTPDMVFIDGSHEYEAVARDIGRWLPTLAPKGLICGHDYTNMIGVRTAVDELVPGAQVAKGTSIWYAYI